MITARDKVRGAVRRLMDVTIVVAFGLIGVGPVQAQTVINACVNPYGELRVVTSPELCHGVETSIAWNVQGPQGEPGPPTVQYRSAQAIGVARAFCLPNEVLVGGGAFVETLGGFAPASLRQSHPISDETGVFAWGSTAIGWQAASSDFSQTVGAFAICAH